MNTLIWSTIAIDDLTDIAKKIGISPAYLTYLIKKLLDRPVIHPMPESGRTVLEMADDDTSVRELLEGNYRIIYRYSYIKSDYFAHSVEVKWVILITGWAAI